MKRIYKIIIIVTVFILMVSMLAACESKEEEESSSGKLAKLFSYSFDSDRIEEGLKKDVNAPELSKEHLKAWDEDFVNSNEYDPVYRNMRFSVNGVSVHIPYTARGFEALFDTEFVYATDVKGSGKDEKIRFYDNDYNFLEVQYNETAEYVDKSGMSLEEKLDLPIQDFLFGSWQDFPQVYPEGHPDTSNGIVDVDRHSLFAIYDVVFENPDEYDSGIIKSAGYGFSIVPAHYLAFREYVAGTLPEESCAGSDVNKFEEYLADQDDEEYYFSDTEREPLRYTVDDVTCDGIDELCVLKDDSVLDIYTYDKRDKCIRKIWTGNTDHNECKIDKGTLMFYRHSPASESDVEEDISYYVLNTIGDTVFNAHLNKNEHCVRFSLTNEEESEYEGTYYVNGNNVSREEYIEACNKYYDPEHISVFDKFEEPGYKEGPSISLDTHIKVYLNHSGYEFTTGWTVEERREQLGLNGGDSPVEAQGVADEGLWNTINGSDESDETSEREEIFKKYLCDVIDQQESVPDMLEVIYYSPDLGIRFDIIDVTGDGQKELLISGTQYDNGPSVDCWWVYGTEGDCIKYIGEMSFYDPESKKIYTNDGTTFEGYTVYEIDGGEFVKMFHIGERDVENQADRYYMEDAKGNISAVTENEMQSFRDEFNLGMSKYGMQGKQLDMQNIE